MPVPIRLNKNDKSQEDSFTVDYSFLSNMSNIDCESSSKTVIASDGDAKILFKLWNEAKDANNGKIILSNNYNNSDIIRLKARGFITGSNDAVEFTRRGKKIITTLALSEESAFDNKRQEKSYREILSSMDKRGKKGYRLAN